jgi:DNA repair exonuclease SbcCD ATPase subunit
MKYFLKSISIEGFRGINNEANPLRINLNVDGVTSIFGENGSGKSSVFEAFLFAILGRIIRFDDYHIDIKDKKSIKNLFHHGDGIIEIEFIDEKGNNIKICLKIGINGERIITSSSIPDPEKFLSTLCTSLNFLDYRSFVKIMLTSSEETGKLFSNLVGFGNFIIIKEKFDKISRTQNINSDFGKIIKEQTIQKNSQRISDIKVEILENLKITGNELNTFNENDVLKALNSFLQKQYYFKIKKITDKSQIDFDTLISTKIGPQYEENLSKFNSIQENINELQLLEKCIRVFNKSKISILSNKLKKAYHQIKTPNDILLGKLYDEAIVCYVAIENFDKNTCILCETSDLGRGQKTFYDEINGRIKSYILFKNKYNDFISEFQQLIQTCRLIDIENKYVKAGEKFFARIEALKDFLSADFFLTNQINKIISEYKNNLKDDLKKLKGSLKELKSLIPPKISELVDSNNAFKRIFHSQIEIYSLSKDISYNSNFLAELEKWTRYINKVKDDYEDSYNLLMDEISTMIDSDTKFFFKEIMGNVEVTPKLKKEYKGQKVNILLEKFYSNTTEIKAAPLLSESYRNALCLSIYFSTALKSRNSGCFIILDDITSSFDSGHQLYLLDLIKTKIALNPSNKNGKQIIMLTHDGLLKKPLNEYNKLKYWSHFTLNAIRDNVSLKPFTSDDLKLVIHEKINNGNYLGSDFRIYYESVLLEIIERLNLQIPYSLIYNNQDKMVNNLVLAIEYIVQIQVLAKKVKSRLVPDKSDFKLYNQIFTNNLSHWVSGREASLSKPVLLKIIDDIDTFKRLFQYNCTCPARNAGWIYYKSLTSPKHKGCTCTL